MTLYDETKESKSKNTDQIFPYKIYHSEQSYNEYHLPTKENPIIKTENSDQNNSLVKKDQNISESFGEGNLFVTFFIFFTEKLVQLSNYITLI